MPLVLRCTKGIESTIPFTAISITATLTGAYIEGDTSFSLSGSAGHILSRVPFNRGAFYQETIDPDYLPGDGEFALAQPCCCQCHWSTIGSKSNGTLFSAGIQSLSQVWKAHDDVADEDYESAPAFYIPDFDFDLPRSLPAVRSGDCRATDDQGQMREFRFQIVAPLNFMWSALPNFIATSATSDGDMAFTVGSGTGELLEDLSPSPGPSGPNIAGRAKFDGCNPFSFQAVKSWTGEDDDGGTLTATITLNFSIA